MVINLTIYQDVHVFVLTIYNVCRYLPTSQLGPRKPILHVVTWQFTAIQKSKHKGVLAI